MSNAQQGRTKPQESQAWSTVLNRLQSFQSMQPKSISNIKAVNLLQTHFKNESEAIQTLQPKLENAYQAALHDTAEQERVVSEALDALTVLMTYRNAPAAASDPSVLAEKRSKKRRLEEAQAREGGRSSPAPPQGAAMAHAGSSSSAAPPSGGKRPPPSHPSARANPTAGGPGPGSGSFPPTITVTTSMKPVQQQQQQQQQQHQHQQQQASQPATQPHHQQQKKLKRDCDGTPSAGGSVHGNVKQSGVLAVGRPVAVRPPPEGGAPHPVDDSGDYILAHVVKYAAPDTYHVQDVEGEEGKPGAIFVVPSKHLVPLPDPKDRSTFPATDFAAGSQVMAVYPDTTSLYHGKVVGLPGGGAMQKKREGGDNTYKIIFDDDGNSVKSVPMHLVARWKK